jgi:hypothetical protein
MKAISPTIWQPYIAGVLHGDGWCTDLTLGLRVKDRDFAEVFASGVNSVCRTILSPKIDERGYWLVRASNRTGRFSHLKSYVPANNAERAAWIRGLFDSEGNAQITALPRVGPGSFVRRIAMFSTNQATLNTASAYLTTLGISNAIRATKNSASHKGTKTVFVLHVRGREGFAGFSCLIGSSIARKQSTIQHIVDTFEIDPSAGARRRQLLGAAAKRRKTMAVTLPSVISGVRDLIASGVKPTHQACRVIPGFSSIQRYVRQVDLVAAAMEDK